MTALRMFVSRALDVLLRRRREARLSEEIQAHVDMLTDELLAAGMSAADARHAVRRRFGVVDDVKADYREQRGLPWLNGLWQDVRSGLRLLRRDRAFALTACLVLALGIGVNNMLFTIMYAHTLRGLPIPAAERVLYLTTVDAKTQDGGVSMPEFQDLVASARSFAGVAAFTSEPVVVAGDGRAPDRREANFASGNAFALLGVHVVHGRGLAPADDRPGRPALGVIGHDVWQSRYGGDPGVLGRALIVNGAPTTIVGVLADRSGFPSNAAIWLPLAHAPGLSAQPRERRSLSAFGRLRDGASALAAAAEVDALFTRLSIEHPRSNATVRARTVPIDEQYFGRASEPTWLAFMAAGFVVVLISATNVANLMLARGMARARELAIRTSLGASRLRVFRQLLVEGIVLAGVAGIAGLGLAVAGVRLFFSAIPENALPYWFDYSLDVRIVASLVAVSMLSVLVFAVLPAIKGSRSQVADGLRAGGRSSAPASRRWTTVFLAAEVGLAVVLLAGFAVGLRTAKRPLPADRLIETPAIVTGILSLPPDTYGDPRQRTEFFGKLRERLHVVPGVATMSVTTALPLAGGLQQRLQIANQATSTAPVLTLGVGPRYFRTLGLTMVHGREFSPAGADGSGGTAVVNERFAQQFFPDRDPIGQRLTLSPVDGPPVPPRWLTIVGIAPNFRQRRPADPEAIVYTSYEAAPSASAAVVVRGHRTPDELVRSLKDEVRAIDPSLPVDRVRTMRDVVREAVWVGRISAALFLTLTGIAVGLSVLGVYAVAAHGVTRRTHEIGVRLALGASRMAVVWMILRAGLRQVAAGFVVGVGCTVVWEHLFSSGDAAVRATDPRSLAMVAAALVLLTCAACALPAMRATRLDPLAAIRHE